MSEFDLELAKRSSYDQHIGLADGPSRCLRYIILLILR